MTEKQTEAPELYVDAHYHQTLSFKGTHRQLWSRLDETFKRGWDIINVQLLDPGDWDSLGAEVDTHHRWLIVMRAKPENRIYIDEENQRNADYRKLDDDNKRRQEAKE